MPVKSNVRRSVCTPHAAPSSSPSVKFWFLPDAALGSIPQSALRVLYRENASGGFFVMVRFFGSASPGLPVEPIRFLPASPSVDHQRPCVPSQRLALALSLLALAVVMGFAPPWRLQLFEFGKSIAGIDTVSRDEVVQMRAEITRLREEGQECQTVALTAKFAYHRTPPKESLMAQVRQPPMKPHAARGSGLLRKADPRRQDRWLAHLRAAGGGAGGMQLRWQVLVIQADRNAPEFNGRLNWCWRALDGKPWTQTQSPGPAAAGQAAPPPRTRVPNLSPQRPR